jgi:hypothetical protein
MRNRTFVLRIEPWDEGPAFVPKLKPRRQESRIHPALAFDLDGERNPGREPIKPIGFYVTYSYTLFRKGQGPSDPLYALF